VSRLKIGAVGFGYWGPNLVRNLAKMPEVELVGICDASERNRKKAEVAHPGVPLWESLTQMLSGSELDGVVIATSAPSHHELAKQALLAGKHVFVEKPLTLTSADAADLVRLAENSQLTLMVGHLMLYHGAIEWIRDYLASGELGDVRYVYAQRLNLGKVRTAENAFWSLAPHDVSMILHLIDEVPVSVSANGAAYLHEDVADTVFANLKFASGKMANIHVSWLDPHKVRRLTVVGSKKMLVFDDMEATEKVWVYDKGVEPAEALAYGEDLSLRFGDITVPFIKMTEPLIAELTHFANCCQTGSTPRSSGLDGLHVVQVLEAADHSVTCGGAPAMIEA
jgi:predicted dehydrogenase